MPFQGNKFKLLARGATGPDWTGNWWRWLREQGTNWRDVLDWEQRECNRIQDAAQKALPPDVYRKIIGLRGEADPGVWS